VVLKESSSDESSDNESAKASAPAASANVSNDKRTRVTANSVNSAEAFNGNSSVSFSLTCTVKFTFMDCAQSAVNGNSPVWPLPRTRCSAIAESPRCRVH